MKLSSANYIVTISLTRNAAPNALATCRSLHFVADVAIIFVLTLQLLADRFEIIVILEGTVESNGKLTQVRTSYLPSEILWGHRLSQLVTRMKSSVVGSYDIDYRQFHGTTPVTMPECSAKLYHSIGRQRQQRQHQQKETLQPLAASKEMEDKQEDENNNDGRMTSAEKSQKPNISEDKNDLDRASVKVESARETPSLTRHIYRRRIEVRTTGGQTQLATPPTAN